MSFVAGIIFSTGLTISGMVNPFKVKGFLDIFGNWDYSLAFVMGGAVIFNLASFYIILNKKPLFSESYFLPKKFKADRNLILGAILFGAGWGLVGVCPGPALVNAVTLNGDVFIFIISMTLGIILFKGVEKKLA
mgnify:CR=1 FL=1